MDIDKLVDSIKRNIAEHPECDIYAAELAAQEGRKRKHAVFYLGRAPDVKTEITDFADPQRKKETGRYTVEKLVEDLSSLARPPAMLNPIRACIGLGVGPGTLAASFGCRLEPDLNYCPSNSFPVEEIIRKGVPVLEEAGLMPLILEKIGIIRRNVPPFVKIALPDMQGPFNLAHMILGNEVFTLPLERPDEFRQAMSIITRYYLDLHRLLRERIGPERLTEYRPGLYRVAECSVNMVSSEMYCEHILPHDLTIMEEWGLIGIHTCSGPHVFYATIRNLPKIICTEAGFIACATAGWTDVDKAQQEIGGRPIVLNIGQELPEGREEEVLRKDLERLAANPRIMLGHTGMHWKRADEPKMLDLHRRMNEYYRSIS